MKHRILTCLTAGVKWGRVLENGDAESDGPHRVHHPRPN